MSEFMWEVLQTLTIVGTIVVMMGVTSDIARLKQRTEDRDNEEDGA